MFRLIGLRDEWYPYNPLNFISRTVVATFSTQEAADEYIEASRLSVPYNNTVFRSISLLRDYTNADIEEVVPDDVPHDPKL